MQDRTIRMLSFPLTRAAWTHGHTGTPKHSRSLSCALRDQSHTRSHSCACALAINMLENVCKWAHQFPLHINYKSREFVEGKTKFPVFKRVSH